MPNGRAQPPCAGLPAQQSRERQRSAGLPPRQLEPRLLPVKEQEDLYNERLQEDVYLALPAFQERLRADLAATVEQALRPLAEQVQDNGCAVLRLAQAHNERINGLESRLQEERRHAEQRCREREELLRLQAGGLEQLVLLESMLRLQEQRPQQPPGGSAPSQQQCSRAAGQGARAGGPALADALVPVQAALARVEAKLAPVEAALAREEVRPALARVEEGLASMEAALAQKDLWSNAAAEATLARIEAKLASVEAELARREAAFAPSGSCWRTATGEPAAWTLATLSASRGTDGPTSEKSASIGQGSPAREMALAAEGTKPEQSQVANQPQEGEPNDKQHDERSAPAQSSLLAPTRSRCSEDAPRSSSVSRSSRFFNPVSYMNDSEAEVEKDRPTFFGIEYEELQHLHDTTSSRTQRNLIGMALRWTDWILSFEESRCFEVLVAACIVVNAGFMLYAINDMMARALDDQAPAETSIEGVEVVFLSAYALEVILKLAVHRLYYFVNSDMHWNIFDCVLLLMALVDFFLTNLATAEPVHVDALVLRSMRILKLTKILRVLRILRVFDSLRLLLGSLIGSFISLIWSLVMMGFVYYFFGLIFVQTLTNFVAEYGDGLDPGLRQDIMANFGTVMVAMLSLLKATTGGDDWSLYFGILEPIGWAVPALFLFFVCFVQISLLNILTAVFIDHAMRLAEPDTIAQAKEQNERELAAAAELRRMCCVMDSDGSGSVSAREFRAHLSTKEMRCCFKVLGLDIRGTQEFFELLAYANGGDEVDIETFVQGCMRMRGGATGIAQQKLIMEAHLLRKTQKEHFGELSKVLDVVAARLRLPEGRPRALSPVQGDP